LDAYKLKWIAIIAMILNHAAHVFEEILPLAVAFPIYAAGGFTFPIMAYFISEGYKYTSSLEKYIMRLLIFGLLASPFFIFAFSGFALNIMFTIALGLIVLLMYDKMKVRPFFWVIFVLILVLTAALPLDWSFIGVIVMFLYHAIKNEKLRRIIPGIVAGVLLMTLSALGIMPILQEGGNIGIGDLKDFGFAVSCFSATILLSRFNGERGKRMKWLFYTFYPIHLAVLTAVAFFIGILAFPVFNF